MYKYRTTDVKSFEFSDLEGNHVSGQSVFKSFQFQTLTGDSLNSETLSDGDIRSERQFAQKNNFTIDEIVRDYRGLSRQEQTDLEQKIQQEVNRRMELAHEQAYNEGLEKGQATGKQMVAEELQSAMKQKVEEFSKVIEHIQDQSNKILDRERHEVYEFIKRFTKWIILKEIDEKRYLESLLEKLILELNSRKNLIVKVGRSNFSQMPDVMAIVEGRLGQLSNVRIEIVPELNYPGIILETENGLIDGSMEGVFSNIDKIFAQVVKHE